MQRLLVRKLVAISLVLLALHMVSMREGSLKAFAGRLRYQQTGWAGRHSGRPLRAAVPKTITSQVAAISVFVPVLLFHHVKWSKPTDDAIERGLTVFPTEFRAELDYLARHNYHTITAAKLVDRLRQGGSLPAHPVVLTFDDGYADMYPDVYPLLRQMHMVATFFIVPGFLDSPRYLTWRQVVTMSRHGMDIESHTMTHPDLRYVGAAQQWTEIWESRRMLEARLHRSIRVFAYPYGGFNPHIVAGVTKAGYWAAFTTQQGWKQQARSAFTLPRVYVDVDDTISIFAGRLRGDQRILSEDPT